jgi:hypothetical protein
VASGAPALGGGSRRRLAAEPLHHTAMAVASDSPPWRQGWRRRLRGAGRERPRPRGVGREGGGAALGLVTGPDCTDGQMHHRILVRLVLLVDKRQARRQAASRWISFGLVVLVALGLPRLRRPRRVGPAGQAARPPTVARPPRPSAGSTRRSTTRRPPM